MAFKTYDFELPQVDEEISLELEYSYYHDPGKYSGPPEDCYPSETECEIELEKDWEKRVMAHYEAAGREAIKAIEAKVEELVNNKAPAEWAKDDYEERGM